MKLIKQNPLVVFLVLTFAITWALWIPAALAKLNGQAPALGPDTFPGGLARWAPGIAAVLVTAVLAGRPGIRDLLRPAVIWRVPIGWYAAALLLPPVLLLLSQGIDSLLGRSAPVVSPLESLSGPLAFVIPVMVLLAVPGSFAEELGWRGFALPALQDRMNAVNASIVIALFWGAWHIPIYLYYGETGIPAILLSIFNFIPGSILYTWLYNNTRGSLLPVTLYHAMQQFVNTFWGLPSTTQDLLGWLVAAALVLVFGVQLKRSCSEASPATPSSI